MPKIILKYERSKNIEKGAKSQETRPKTVVRI